MPQANIQQEHAKDKTSVVAHAQERSEDMEATQADRFDRNSVNNPEPSHEDISQRAYQLWEEGGSPEGSQDEYWFRAENEIRTRPS
jgi:hypothetical protein